DLIPQVGMIGGTVTAGGTAVTAYVTEETTNPFEGASYAKMTTVTVAGLTGQAAAANGIHGGTISQKFKADQAYSGVTFTYKANLTANDSAGVVISGFDAAGSLVSQGTLGISQSTTTWTTA